MNRIEELGFAVTRTVRSLQSTVDSPKAGLF